ncbi:MAG: transposase [Gammaproteobacteria bacterium]|nr:transposase [Gammaproteobacteria bacterium]MCW8987992.1 transposase [Gammaproteobacteria bacterium]
MSFNELRKGRFSEEGRVYFVTMVTQERTPYFTNFYMTRKAIQQIRLLHDEEKVYSYAWVIMPDHMHWLFQLNDNQSLPKVVNLFKGRTARVLNNVINNKGKFWQPAYFDHAVRNDECIKQIARYIVANPLRANLVDRIEDYPHWDADWL